MLHCTIVLKNNIPLSNIMSFAAAVTQLSFPMLPLAMLVRGTLVLALLAGFVLFFRPLLLGVVRALLLLVRPGTRRARPAAGALGSGA